MTIRLHAIVLPGSELENSPVKKGKVLPNRPPENVAPTSVNWVVISSPCLMESNVIIVSLPVKALRPTVSGLANTSWRDTSVNKTTSVSEIANIFISDQSSSFLELPTPRHRTLLWGWLLQTNLGLFSLVNTHRNGMKKRLDANTVNEDNQRFRRFKPTWRTPLRQQTKSPPFENNNGGL